MRYNRFSVFLFAAAYFTMLFANSPVLKYLPIVITLISVLVSGAERTFTVYSCFMFFSYPVVNFGALLIIAVALFFKKKKICIIDRNITSIVLLFNIWLLIDTVLTRISGSNWNDWLSWMFIFITIIVCQNISRRDTPYEILKGIQIAGVLLVALQIGSLAFPQINVLVTSMNAIRIPDINYRSIAYASCMLITEFLIKEKYEKKIVGIFKIALFVFGVFTLG